MSENIKYFIDGKVFTTYESELTIDKILDEVGLSANQYYVVSKDGIEYRDPDQTIKINNGDSFETRKHEDSQTMDQAIRYKVNGEEQTTTENPLTVEMILRNAGATASIDVTQINSYFLENLASGHKYENLTDRVTIKEDDQFLAVHVGRTPVA